MILFFYILVVLTRHLFENSNVFHFFKVPIISSFLLIKEKNYSSLQDKVLSLGRQILLIFNNWNVTPCDPSVSLKLKDLIFAVNINYKTKFLEVIHRQKLPWEETYRFVITHLSFFLMHLEISLYIFVFILKMILWKFCYLPMKFLFFLQISLFLI